MTRITLTIEPDVVEKLRSLAEQRGISLAALAREALEAKAAECRPVPKSLGAGSSGRPDVSLQAGVGRAEPRRVPSRKL